MSTQMERVTPLVNSLALVESNELREIANETMAWLDELNRKIDSFKNHTSRCPVLFRPLPPPEDEL